MDLDLENGGGNGVAVLSAPAEPADPQREEPQPFTWLRAAPYIVATLASAALVAVGVVLVRRSCPVDADDDELIRNVTECDVGIVVTIIGGILVAFAIAASTALSSECCCVPRLA